MTRYLLDTNHLSPLVTPGHPVRALVLERAAAGDSFTIPAPVLSEFLYGMALLPRRDENQALWRELADNFATTTSTATTLKPRPNCACDCGRQAGNWCSLMPW